MSDDRFGDLGRPPERERRSAAERFADLDVTSPEPDAGPPAPPKPSGRYTWVVGIVFLIAIAAASLNAIRTEGPGVLGPEPGQRLPVFAAPAAAAGLEKDANVQQRGARTACDVVGRDVVNLCRLARRGPVVVTFMFTRFADCAPQLDRVERARARVPGVTFVGVIVREPPGAAQRLVRERGWGYPVALDRDGQVSNVFGIGGCPTTVFADRGGKVRATRIGQLDEAAIVREARALLAPARR
jgi:hypothetical protein